MWLGKFCYTKIAGKQRPMSESDWGYLLEGDEVWTCTSLWKIQQTTQSIFFHYFLLLISLMETLCTLLWHIRSIHLHRHFSEAKRSYFHFKMNEKHTYGKTLRHLLIFKENIFFSSKQKIWWEIGSCNDGIQNCIKEKDALHMPLKTKPSDSQRRNK